MKNRLFLLFAVTLLAVLPLRADDWAWTGVKSVSQIPTNVGNTSVPKTGNCHVAVDNLGNVIGVYGLQGSDTRFVYKVMAPGETAFPSEPVQALGVVGVPLRLMNIDGQVKCFYYFVDGTQRNLYMSTWNSTMKVFENPVKIGFNLYSSASVEYFKDANGHEYVISDCNFKTSASESMVVMKVNTGAGWNSDSLLVATKGRSPKFVSRNGAIEIYFLDSSVSAAWRLKMISLTGVTLSDPIVLYNSDIVTYELIMVNNVLKCAYTSNGIIHFANIDAGFQVSDFVIPQNNAAMQTFRAVLINNQIHVVKSQGASFCHWIVAPDCASGSEVASYAVTAQNTGSLALWLTDSAIHAAFLVYDINRGTGFGANTYYNSVPYTGSGIEASGTPQNSLLLSNYPNPFNNSTIVNYQLATDNFIKLAVYNSKGELVKTLVNGKQSAGNHGVAFSADGLNSGVYYCRLAVDGRSVVSKLVLCK